MGTIKDVIQIAKIVAIVVNSFNFNSFQENKFNNYVRMQQYEWIAQRKSEQEVEEMIKAEARYISTE